MPDNIVTDPTTGGATQPVSTIPTIPVAPVLKPTPPPVKQMTAQEYNQHLVDEADNKPATVTPTAAPTTNTSPKNSTAKLTPQQITSKWAGNPYLVGGRDKWGDDMQKTFPFSGSPVKDSVYDAAKATGLDPYLIAPSSMEEGMSGLLHPDKNGQYPSTADDKFPVNGYSSFGLDNFGSQAKDLINKGLLSPDFVKKFKTTTKTNEKGQTVTSSNFADEPSGVLAAAAVLKNSRNNLDAYTQKTGTTLTPRQEDFFNLAAFNLGDAGAQKMLESYKSKGYLKNDNFLNDPNFKPESYGDVYTHVQRRLVPGQQMKDNGVFSDYKPPTPIQPLAINNQNRTDWNAFQDSKNPSLSDYIKQNPKTSLTLPMAGALQQDLNAHKEHLKNLVNTGQAFYDNGVTHENVGANTHKFSQPYMAANK